MQIHWQNWVHVAHSRRVLEANCIETDLCRCIEFALDGSFAYSLLLTFRLRIARGHICYELRVRVNILHDSEEKVRIERQALSFQLEFNRGWFCHGEETAGALVVTVIPGWRREGSYCLCWMGLRKAVGSSTHR